MLFIPPNTYLSLRIFLSFLSLKNNWRVEPLSPTQGSLLVYTPVGLSAFRALYANRLHCPYYRFGGNRKTVATTICSGD
uniref:Uncharacterized protein n=1 Tax=Picea glauca TaxID=3330 RepID=A0A117NIK3_PICGL|nr:hypothetical protein ABT39_MTgene3243 [Picea glauca]QHR89257.1 hypothetical protein Q903MT_gene3277 [Picea sitchensis]